MTNVVSFPGLGLEFELNRVAFSVFGKDVYWYGIIIALGFILAVLYGYRRAPRYGVDQDKLMDMLFFAVPLCIIGARVYYVIFNPSICYNPDGSFSFYRAIAIWDGGLAIYGGIIGMILGVTVFCRLRKIRVWTILDVVSLGFLIGQCLGRWGNFFNREAHGSETDCFLRMGLTDAAGSVTYYHPTFLYESAWNLLGFVLLHWYSKRRKYDGQIFTMYIAWYGFGRMFIEGLRTDSLYIPGTGIRVSQLLAGVSFIAAAGILIWQSCFRKHNPRDLWVNRAEPEH